MVVSCHHGPGRPDRFPGDRCGVHAPDAGKGWVRPVPAATVRAMGPTPFTYSPLTLDRRTLDEVAVLGARSFYDDPFFIHLSDESVKRARGLTLYMRTHMVALGDSAVATGARNAAG